MCQVAEFASCSPHHCKDHGRGCANGVCDCAVGYEGIDCSIVVGCDQDSFCSGHGLCDDEKQACQCFDGWEGPDCGTEVLCQDSCSGRGYCSGSPNYECSCVEGLRGPSCASIITNCPSGCSGQGRCNETSGLCHCRKGFFGPACASAELPSVCSKCKHGKCVLGDESSPSVCKCNVGWEGEHCDEVTACRQLGYCNGRGACVDGVCNCFLGFSSEQCLAESASPCAPHFCSGHGKCVDTSARFTSDGSLVRTGHCVCDKTYQGSDCSVSKCLSANSEICSGHGICRLVNGTSHCYCDEGFRDADCSQIILECPGVGSPCSGHGTCSNGLCTCDSEWKGDDCATSAIEVIAPSPPPCCPLNCSDNGFCNMVACKCECNPDWTGTGCEVFNVDIE